MKVHRHGIATATATLSMLLLSNTASAASSYEYDRKTYTGAQCQPAYGIQSGDFTIYQGKLRNDAAGVRWVSCAITFDAEDTLIMGDFNASTSAGSFWLRVWLDYSGVPAGVTSYTTNCTIAGRSPWLGTSVTETLDVTSSKTSTHQEINFSPAVFDGLDIGDDTTIQVSCLLPSKVAISGIKVYEYGDTGGYLYTP